MQNFLESGDLKVNEIKVRLDKLSSILNKFEVARDELECLDDTDYSIDREEFENQYCQVEAKFNELLHLVVEQPFSRRSSPRSSL
jgi:guanylate kinase